MLGEILLYPTESAMLSILLLLRTVKFKLDFWVVLLCRKSDGTSMLANCTLQLESQNTQLFISLN